MHLLPQRHPDPHRAFDLLLPPGWSVAPAAEGVEVERAQGAGTLHLLGIARDADNFPDPAEELFAFLDGQGVELEEDEVEDVSLADDAEMALCEYLEEDEAGEPTFWLLAVATAPGGLVFATYSCDADAADLERAAVRAILTSLRLPAP